MTTDKITDTETLESVEGNVNTVDNPVALAIAEAEEVPDPLEGLAEESQMTRALLLSRKQWKQLLPLRKGTELATKSCAKA